MKHDRSLRVFAHLWRYLLVGSLAALTGCSSYHLGTGARLAFHTLYIAPVENRSSVTQAEALVSAVLREEFIRDGRVHLVNSAGEADATLSVVLTGYHRDVATVRAGDTGLARKNALTLGAAVSLRDNRAGKVLIALRPVEAVRDAFTDSGQILAENEALPQLAAELAKKVAHGALDVW